MIRVADNFELEIDQLMHLTLAAALKLQARWYEGEIWNIGGKRVKCVVKRRTVRGKLTYVRLLEADGWRMSRNALLYELREG